MPAPFFADSLDDKLVLLAQKGLRDVFELARRADLYLVGIGEVGPEAHLLTTRHDHGRGVPPSWRARVPSARCWAASSTRAGRPVAADVNERAVAVDLERLRGTDVVAIAGGAAKPAAIAAVLPHRLHQRPDHRRGDRVARLVRRRGAALP